MKHRKFRIQTFFCGLVLCMVAGCMVRMPVVEEHPWYLQSSGLYRTAEGNRFYGVGRASGIRSSTLLKATAGNAARKEMDRILRQYVAVLAAEAASHVQGPPLSREAWEQLSGLVVRDAARRAVISDQWAPASNRLLALCELNLDTLKRILADDRLPQVEARQAMWHSADKVHASLSRPFQSN